MAGARPVTADGAGLLARPTLTRGYPAGFETPGPRGPQLETLVEYQPARRLFQHVHPPDQPVTAADVLRVARQHLDPAHLTIVVVADRSKVEASLRELPAGKSLEVRQVNEDLALGLKR